MRFLVFPKLLILSLCVFSVSASAQTTFNHCENAKHTGDILTCVKKRHDSVTSGLNPIYEKILRAQSDGEADRFRQAQQDWIVYRDRECGWEVSQVEAESLRRIEELKCVTALTEQRRVTLEKFYEALGPDADTVEMEAVPRWMNVVADENPEVFWRYGDRLSADLNCDDQREEIMLGQGIKLHSTNEKNGEVYDFKTVVAVIQNPVIGKPKVEVFDLARFQEDDAQDKDKVLCDPNLTFSLVERLQTEKESAENLPAEFCSQALRIERKYCAAVLLFRNGETYTAAFAEP